jgi:integrin alpha 7
VKHKYEIKNVGRARVPRSTVFISWPYELHSEYSSGKHLLYLIEEPLLDGDVKCFIDRRMINPLKILSRSRTPLIPQNADNSTVEEDKSRRKRASEKTERSPDVRKMIQSSANVVTLDCDQKSARCYTFNCSLGELKPGRSFVIRIRSRLWNSTFLEDYPDVDAVVIYSKAEVKIDPELNIKQTSMDNDVLKIMTTATPEAQEPARVPIWVIIVSVVAGVIILVILILLLWKCGFFRRHQRDQMVTHKAKMQRKSYEDYHD